MTRSFHTVFEVVLEESCYFEDDFSEVETFRVFFESSTKVSKLKSSENLEKKKT